MIHKVYVKKDISIPTHSAVGIVVSRNAIERERSYVGTCPSLKVLHLEKVERETNDFEGKGKREGSESKWTQLDLKKDRSQSDGKVAAKRLRWCLLGAELESSEDCPVISKRDLHKQGFLNNSWLI